MKTFCLTSYRVYHAKRTKFLLRVYCDILLLLLKLYLSSSTHYYIIIFIFTFRSAWKNNRHLLITCTVLAEHYSDFSHVLASRDYSEIIMKYRLATYLVIKFATITLYRVYNVHTPTTWMGGNYFLNYKNVTYKYASINCKN